MGTFQLSVGLFQVVVGAMMLVAPHQFTSASYTALQPHLSLWGVAFFLIGAVLLAVPLLGLPRPVEFAAHLLSGAALVTIAYGLALVGGWTGTTNLGVMGIGIALAPVMQSASLRGHRLTGSHWLAIVAGTGAVLTGLTILGLPDQFSSPIYDVVRSYLPWLAGSFLLGGVLLLAASLGSNVPRTLTWAAHLLAGGTLITFCLISSVPLRAWIGIAYYGGFGLLIALLPWMGDRPRAMDPHSLRARLAFTLSLVAVLPLLPILSFALDRQEQATLTVALSQQRGLADTVAQDLADYVRLHQAVVVALAAQPGLIDASPADQQRTLRAVSSAYPDIFLMTSYGTSSNQVARTDNNPPQLSVGTPLLQTAIQTGRPTALVEISPTTNRPILAVAAPVLSDSGERRGMIAAGVDLTRVEELLRRARSNEEISVYVVDQRGRTIASRESSLVSSFADFSSEPPVAAMLATEAGFGALQYGSGATGKLAGYATVPDYGWGVVVEQSTSVVLAETRVQRDGAFALLLLVAVLTTLAGATLAERLTRPLAALGEVVRATGRGVRTGTLLGSDVSEVRQLTQAVDEMRKSLGSAEVERERLLREVTELDRLKDQFILVAAHELKTPLTILRANTQALLRRAGDVPPERRRMADAIVRGCDRMDRIVQDLLDISKLQSGQLELFNDLVPLHECVARAIDRRSYLTSGRVVRVVRADPAVVMANAERLEQVMANLLDNAVRYSPQGGDVEVAVASEDGQARVSVRDHGVGIPRAKQDKIFQRFYRAHTKTANDYGGMGVGLYMAREIISRYGGRVWFESVENEGSTFHFSLPVRG